MFLLAFCTKRIKSFEFVWIFDYEKNRADKISDLTKQNIFNIMVYAWLTNKIFEVTKSKLTQSKLTKSRIYCMNAVWSIRQINDCAQP